MRVLNERPWRLAIPLTVALLGVLLVPTWRGGGAEGANVTLKCATATLNDVQHEWCKRYGARLEKRSNGQIKAQIFPASQLGSIPRMIEGVQLGTIEAWVGPP